MTPCEKRLRAAPCWTKPIPASSKTSPLQGAAEAVSDAGGASVTAHLRKGKNNWAAAVRERKM